MAKKKTGNVGYNGYNKVTNGFVIQKFNKVGSKFICNEQSFTAGDVAYETDEGDSIFIADVETKEQYQPFEMVQPKDESRLDLALTIMTDRQVEQFQKAIDLLDKGVTFDELPNDIFEG